MRRSMKWILTIISIEECFEPLHSIVPILNRIWMIYSILSCSFACLLPYCGCGQRAANMKMGKASSKQIIILLASLVWILCVRFEGNIYIIQYAIAQSYCCKIFGACLPALSSGKWNTRLRMASESSPINSFAAKRINESQSMMLWTNSSLFTGYCFLYA